MAEARGFTGRFDNVYYEREKTMKLTPKEQERLTIFTLAELARRRRARGIQLNYPEAVALICDEVMEEARAGRSFAEVVAHGMQVLTENDVMEGVPELLATVSVEPVFEDGTKLIILSYPVGHGNQTVEREGTMSSAPIMLNASKPTITLVVTNSSDHPVHVTSHMPFWQINPRMQFDRAQATGYHLDIPAGGAVRWEPGETKEVQLCPLK